jgi:hypothetical protein
MSSKFRWVSTAVLTAGLTLAGTTAAMAGTPSPSPSQQPATPNFGYNPKPCLVVTAPIPQPLRPGVDLRNCHGIQQQEFDISDHGFQVRPGVFREQDQVLGTGPIRFDLGRDVTVTPTIDRLRQFGNSVLIHHAAIGAADVTVDRAACSILVSQRDLPYWILGGGTGFYRNAVSAGVYDLNGLVSFPTRNFTCTLPVALTATQAAYDLNSNTGGGLPLPLMTDFSVQAAGWSALNLRPVPHVFSPTANPTNS